MAQNKSTTMPLAAGAALLGGLLMAAGQWMILELAPVEQYMGLVQKIFYLHLPLAWWGMISFFLVFLGSIVYLVKRSPFWDALCEAAAEVGLVLAGLALITGSMWARKSWNTWWTWDPRLTTTLVMWFIYAAYLIVRKMDFSPERRGVISAVIGVVAFLDVPLVFFSARLWPQTIHPTVVREAGSGGMDPDMKLTMIFCVASFSLIWAALVALRTRLGLAEARLDDHQAQMALNG